MAGKQLAAALITGLVLTGCGALPGADGSAGAQESRSDQSTSSAPSQTPPTPTEAPSTPRNVPSTASNVPSTRTQPTSPGAGSSRAPSPGSTGSSTHSLLIKVGHCTGPLEGDLIDNVELLACQNPHYWEAYAATEIPGRLFPGDTVLDERAEEFCEDEFERFIGIPYGDSRYTWTFLKPSKESWRDGDRELMCLVGSETGGITGSLRNTHQ